MRGPDIVLYDGAQKLEDLHDHNQALPILVVMVLSPTDRASPFMSKMLDYLQNGVALVWVVNPGRRTVAVYTSGNGPRFLDERETLSGGDDLPGLKCKVADFFRLPGDKAKAPKKRKN